MAYTTGAATTPAQVLDGIQAGAIAGGWTLVHRGADTGGGDLTGYREDILWVSNGSYRLGFSFNMLGSPVSELQCYWASSFNNALPYNEQAGFGSLYSNLVWVPCLAWHVFSTSSNVYVVIEGTVGSFRHLGGGSLIKQDSYTGGSFLYSHISYTDFPHQFPFMSRCNYATYAVRVAGDGYTERWRYNIGAFPNGICGALYDDNSLTDHLISGHTNQFNRQTILVPLYTTVIRSTADTQSPIGYPPNIRGCNVKYLDPAGETITLGPDTWMTFPAGMVGASNQSHDPVNRGLAYQVL